jgi:predicted O-methyltransferase YrrM
MEDNNMKRLAFVAALLLVLTAVALFVFARNTPDAVDFENVGLEPRVKQFLETHAWGGRGGRNVPAVDGLTLHNIVLEKGYTRALEIGTSTGHSTVWIAAALSKTGGKLITIEIDEGRHHQALANLKAAGLSDLVDARLGNAHGIVPALEGPFDFVFSDADKGWYKNYLDATLPKLEVGGCYTTHNVGGWFSGWFGESGDYMSYLYGLPNLETTVDLRGGGLSISYKLSE